MQLRRVLAFSAIMGFLVPIASYFTWRLAYASGLGKILDDWNDRVRFFTSLMREINARADHVIFDYAFWDVLWVAIINVPLSLALGSFWWTLLRKPMQLRRVLVISAIIGFAVPVASYFVSLLIPAPFAAIPWFIDEWLGTDIFSGVFRHVLTVAIVNVPLFMALGSIWWALVRSRRDPKLV